MAVSSVTQPPAAARTGLRRLVDLDPATFAAQHWGREPRHVPAAARGGDDGQDLLSLAAVDRLLSVQGVRTPFLRVARNGVTRPDADFTRGGGVGAGVTDQLDDTALTRLFAEGSTIVLQGLHRTHEPLITLAQDLTADLGHPVQVNAYVTPPQSTGFSAHYDVHDVFVLQTAGEKTWRIHAPVHEHPLRDQPWDQRRGAVADRAAGEPHLDITMRPGDVLYLPRGWLHAATAKGETSAHVTIGVHTWHRGHVADALLAAVTRALAEDPQQRASLPLGADIGSADALADDVEAVRAAMTAALAEVSVAQVAADLGGRQDRSHTPAPVAPVATAGALAGWHEDSRLVLREHVRARLVPNGSGQVLIGRTGRHPVGAAEADRVSALLTEGSARVGDLGEELARGLVLAGVAVPELPATDTEALGEEPG